MRKRQVLVFALPVLLLILTLGQRWLQAQQEDRQAAEEARVLVLQQFRRELEQDAYNSAQSFVRAKLLPAPIASTAQIRQLALQHLKPHRYKVRGEVEWTQADGKRVRRRVEADLQHGPMDKNWYLLDTEFLPQRP